MSEPPTEITNDPRGRLLVVDDNEANRDMLSRRLARRGHTVVVAEDGERALDRIAEESFDVVLLDVMMPGIDGFEVLRRVRTDRAATQLPVIMATARDERDDIVRALKLGANDYVTKPLDFSVVLARVQTQLSLKHAHEKLENANRRMRDDLNAAARLQQALLPSAPPAIDGIRFGWTYRPCAELAGDTLNVFALDERHVGLYVLDVSGHGVPAALLAVTLSRLLAPVSGESSLVRRQRAGAGATEVVPPSEVARELNQRFQLFDGSEQYFTLLYGVLDSKNRTLQYVVAGHPGPVHVSHDQAARRLETPSFPIGWVPAAEYPAQILELKPGDRVYLYSDGIDEAMNRERAPFGKGRIVEALEEGRSGSLGDSIDRLVGAAASWRSAPFEDDVSVLALEIAG